MTKPDWWHLLDRAYKMIEASGFRLTEHDPDHNNPVVAWMADARILLQAVPERAEADQSDTRVKAWNAALDAAVRIAEREWVGENSLIGSRVSRKIADCIRDLHTPERSTSTQITKE